MYVLPVMQCLCVGQHAGMLGVHVHGCTAQINEVRFGMQGQDFLALIVVDGNRKEISLAVGAEQGRRLDRIQVLEFTGFQVNGYLPFIGYAQQATAVPQGNVSRRIGVLCSFNPFWFVAILNQAIQADGGETVTA